MYKWCYHDLEAERPILSVQNVGKDDDFKKVCIFVILKGFFAFISVFNDTDK